MQTFIRTFIAIEIPGELKAAIRQLQEVLMRERGDVKWVRPEGIHITLKFLGDVETGRIPDIGEAVKQAAEGLRTFELQSGGAGFFPGPGRPRVIWIGIDTGADILIRLAEGIDRNLSALGFEKEKRPFSPHVTIGRVRSPGGMDRTVEKLQSLSIPCIGFRVENIIVMKSVLQQTGAVYTPLQTIKLEV